MSLTGLLQQLVAVGLDVVEQKFTHEFAADETLQR
jgi:hypothetical protein